MVMKFLLDPFYYIEGRYMLPKGGKGGSKPPSPEKQATAQGKIDKETAWYNSMLQNMNQYTPYGNLTYTQSGTPSSPKWSSTITLSPEQQQIFDSQNRQGIALNQLGEGQIGRITDAVSTPFGYGGIQNQLPTYDSLENMSAKYTDALMSRLNPQFAQDEEALRTRLINQGIGQGSQAYQREMDSFNQRKNDANIQSILAGQQYGTADLQNLLGLRNQEINEYTTQRNAPLNEYIGLTSGTQIVNPQFQSRGNQGINSFDIAGAMRNDYSNQQAAANNQSQAMSGLFGLGGQALGSYLAREGGALAGSAFAGPVGGFLGSAVGGLFSDRRLKENVELVGEENGFPIYKFNYINIPDKTFIGVMAQDVKDIMPEAVSETEGFMKVDYNMIGVQMREVA